MSSVAVGSHLRNPVVAIALQIDATAATSFVDDTFILTNNFNFAFQLK